MARKVIFFGFIFLLLFAGCSDKSIDSGSDKRIRIGNNNGIAFQNILSGEKKTKYGFSEIQFGLGKYSFAIISVPANEEVSTYISAIITTEHRSPKLSVMTYKNPPNFSLYLNGSDENLQILTDGTKDVTCEIGIKGTFSQYLQENIVFMSSAEEVDVEQETSSKDRQFSGENSLYIIPYTWRTIKVKIDGDGDINDYQEIISWANANVFRQAICKLELATDQTDYDCYINFISKYEVNENIVFTENVVFLDESGKKYDMYNSDEIVSAQIRFAPNLFGSKKNVVYKSFSYAVAYLMGVSEDNSQFNLMIPKDNNVEHIHLTFRQWNQLHVNENGK